MDTIITAILSAIVGALVGGGMSLLTLKFSQHLAKIAERKTIARGKIEEIYASADQVKEWLDYKMDTVWAFMGLEHDPLPLDDQTCPNKKLMRLINLNALEYSRTVSTVQKNAEELNKCVNQLRQYIQEMQIRHDGSVPNTNRLNEISEVSNKAHRELVSSLLVSYRML